MPYSEWLAELQTVENLQSNTPVVRQVLNLQSILRSADESGTAVNLDNRPALVRVAGCRHPTSRVRSLLAVALGDNHNFVSIERHGFNYNSVSNGCDPEHCGVAQLQIEEPPFDGAEAGECKLDYAEGAGALLTPQGLIRGLITAVDWLQYRQGAEDPQESHFGRTAASVMLDMREHEIRLHYLASVVGHVLAV